MRCLVRALSSRIQWSLFGLKHYKIFVRQRQDQQWCALSWQGCLLLGSRVSLRGPNLASAAIAFHRYFYPEQNTFPRGLSTISGQILLCHGSARCIMLVISMGAKPDHFSRVMKQGFYFRYESPCRPSASASLRSARYSYETKDGPQRTT